MYKLYKLKQLTWDKHAYRLHNTKNHTFSYAEHEVTKVIYNQSTVHLKNNVSSLLIQNTLPKHYTLLAEWDYRPTEADLKQTLPELFI